MAVLEAADDRSKGRATGMARQPVTVFIVDDSAQLAEMLGELLGEPGVVEVVGTADSVALALDAIERLRPHLVVVDLQLKDGNGFQVAEGIAAMPERPATEIVFFTNHTSPEFVRRADELGVAHFLDKSRDHAKIVELVRAKIGQPDC
jgi:DNA-binding NarL/FixJ family response regulator